MNKVQRNAYLRTFGKLNNRSLFLLKSVWLILSKVSTIPKIDLTFRRSFDCARTTDKTL